MPTVTAKVNKVDQHPKDYQYDPKAEEEMKKRWDQLKNRKQANHQTED
jgi:hypothetical protein